jgi:hypothetical protein
VRQFLSHLADEGKVAASTQNQARAAILFLYREVLRIRIDVNAGVVRAKERVRVPNVVAPEEVALVVRYLGGDIQLVTRLLYGAGL